MAILKAKTIESALCKKGFVREDKDHRKFRLFVNGLKKSIWTMTSHNDQDIGNRLQACMAEQMHLTRAEFLLFVACSISEQQYVCLLKARGHIN